MSLNPPLPPSRVLVGWRKGRGGLENMHESEDPRLSRREGQRLVPPPPRVRSSSYVLHALDDRPYKCAR